MHGQDGVGGLQDWSLLSPKMHAARAPAERGLHVVGPPPDGAGSSGLGVRYIPFGIAPGGRVHQCDFDFIERL